MKFETRKKSKVILKFYTLNYGFRKPYQVLLDGTICQAALKNNVHIREQFPKYLEDEIKLLSTQCVVLELEKLGNIMKGALSIVKQFGYHVCGHEKKPVGAYECIMSMIGEKNESRYVVATQDYQLRLAARQVPGTPVIYIHGRTPVLEKPSYLSTSVAHAAAQAKFLPPPLPGVANTEPEPEPEPRRSKRRVRHRPQWHKKRKITAPEPEMPKKNTDQAPVEGEAKRKRKRIKLAKHLKEVKREWLAQAQ